MTRRELLLAAVSAAVQKENGEQAIRRIEAETSAGHVAAATLYVRQGATVLQKAFGKAPNQDAVFLLASISKPMTVSAVMQLVERQQVSLTEPVQRYLPEFRGEGRERVLVRHLLTHTSGLPDMLPENTELRQKHAPLADFVAATCRTPLLFAPGTKVKYQSMGILLAAEIVQRIAKQPLPAYLQEHLYRPLGMRQTSLGLGGRTLKEVMPVEVDVVNDWDWNSPYWRNLASPWGGAHASAGDVAKFVEFFAKPDARVLKPATAASMIHEQTTGLTPAWGYGWSLHTANFGTGCSPGTYGHSGSTGTLCWHDPRKDLTLVLLTTKPAEHSEKTLIKPVSELISQTGQSGEATAPGRK